MYPQRELRRLAIHKATVRREIAMSRTQCVEAAAAIAHPLLWVDRALAWWGRLPPILRMGLVPLGAVLQRTIFRRWRTVGKLIRFGPLVLGVVRGLNSIIGQGAERRSDNRASSQNGVSTQDAKPPVAQAVNYDSRFRTFP